MRYSEAIDPAELGRTYTETDEAIETEKQNVPELVYLTIKEQPMADKAHRLTDENGNVKIEGLSGGSDNIVEF